MTIYEQFKELLANQQNQIVTSSYLVHELSERFGTNPKSIIPSDYCYNRINNGINFEKHLFQYITKSTYKYLGENYPFDGLIYQKPKGSKEEVIVGEWRSGVKVLYENNDIDAATNQNNGESNISRDLIMRMYEEYNEILRLEMNILKCKPTEQRHLIGRIGEFLCAIKTKGSLAKVVNQHGFDVVSNGRRISVKTTAQVNGFIAINQNTFEEFDDLFVVQYVDDDFKVIFHGPKEAILKIKRDYETNYEVEINQLRELGKSFRSTS